MKVIKFQKCDIIFVMKKVNIKLKKAFTMLELVFVIVVAGILAAVLIPKINNNRLHEAADQLVSHIRYTQHLAMMGDKFDANNASWYKTRWQLLFSESAGSNNKYAYTIFSDTSGGSSGNPDPAEMAKNPEDSSRLLTGGFSGSIVYGSDKRITKSLNIGTKYGITDVSFQGGCAIGVSKRIAFDYLGRPLKGNAATHTSAYMKDRLVKEQCNITLTNDVGNITISVEPETGYAYKVI